MIAEGRITMRCRLIRGGRRHRSGEWTWQLLVDQGSEGSRRQGSSQGLFAAMELGRKAAPTESGCEGNSLPSIATRGLRAGRIIRVEKTAAAMAEC